MIFSLLIWGPPAKPFQPSRLASLLPLLLPHSHSFSLSFFLPLQSIPSPTFSLSYLLPIQSIPSPSSSLPPSSNIHLPAPPNPTPIFPCYRHYYTRCTPAKAVYLPPRLPSLLSFFFNCRQALGIEKTLVRSRHSNTKKLQVRTDSRDSFSTHLIFHLIFIPSHILFSLLRFSYFSGQNEPTCQPCASIPQHTPSECPDLVVTGAASGPWTRQIPD